MKHFSLFVSILSYALLGYFCGFGLYLVNTHAQHSTALLFTLFIVEALALYPLIVPRILNNKNPLLSMGTFYTIIALSYSGACEYFGPCTAVQFSGIFYYITGPKMVLLGFPVTLILVHALIYMIRNYKQ